LVEELCKKADTKTLEGLSQLMPFQVPEGTLRTVKRAFASSGWTVSNSRVAIPGAKIIYLYMNGPEGSGVKGVEDIFFLDTKPFCKASTEQVPHACVNGTSCPFFQNHLFGKGVKCKFFHSQEQKKALTKAFEEAFDEACKDAPGLIKELCFNSTQRHGCDFGRHCNKVHLNL